VRIDDLSDELGTKFGRSCLGVGETASSGFEGAMLPGSE
jgi:hypothetical protein